MLIPVAQKTHGVGYRLHLEIWELVNDLTLTSLRKIKSS